MDWQDKFSSILRETEANLFKARHRYKIESGLPLRSEMRTCKHSSPMHRSTSLLDFPTSSTPVCVHQNGFSSSQSPNKQVGQPTTINNLDAHPDSCYLGQSLQDRIEQQNRTIEQLTQQVKRLENERAHYDDQFRDLKNEIYKLGYKLTERQSNNHSELLEQRIEHVQQEIWSELFTLKNQIHLSQIGGNKLAIPDVSTYTRDVQDVKNNIQGNKKIDVLNQDMVILKSKLVSIEATMASHLCDELDRQREKLRTDQGLAINFNPSAKQKTVHNSYLSSRNLSDRTPQKQIDELRSTITMMKRKLDNMELNSGKNKSVNGLPLRKPNRSSFPEPDELSILSDSGSSDTDNLSEDLTDSDLCKQISHSISDEELNFENLSLSEDEDSLIANSIAGDEDRSLASVIFQSD